MGRAPCCDKANVKRGPWSPEEDAKLKSYIEQHGTGGNWIALPQKIGLKRCGKSCRLRWLNYLRPNIKHGGFSEEEDNIICSLYVTIGSRWSVIAAQLPGRTDNDIKNYWNTRLKKKLLGKHRKDQQARRGRCSTSDVSVKEGVSNNKSGNINITGDNSSLFVAQSNYPQPQQYSYWPQMPSVSPPLPYSNVDHQDSIRNVLIKLGGRFSDDFVHHDGFNFQIPYRGTTTSTQPVYQLPSVASVSANNNQAVQLGQSQYYCSGLDLVQGGNLIDQEMWAPNDSAALDGLEFLYGEHMNMFNDNQIIGPTPTPTRSCDSNSMVCHPLVAASYRDECMPHQFHFQELRYPEAHQSILNSDTSS